MQNEDHIALVPFPPLKPWPAILLTILSFGFYGLIWLHKMHSGLSQARGEQTRITSPLTTRLNSELGLGLTMASGGVATLYLLSYILAEFVGVARGLFDSIGGLLHVAFPYALVIALFWFGASAIRLGKRVRRIAAIVNIQTGEGMAVFAWLLSICLGLGIALYILSRDRVGSNPVQDALIGLGGFAYLVWMLMAFRGFNMLAYWHVSNAVEAVYDAEVQESDVKKEEEG